MIASSLRFRMLAAAQKGGSPESCVWPCRPHSTLRPRGFNEAMKLAPETKVTDFTILFIQQVAGNLKGGAVSDGDRPMAGRCLQEWQHESFAEDSVPTRPECYLQAGSGRSCFARKQIPGAGSARRHLQAMAGSRPVAGTSLGLRRKAPSAQLCRMGSTARRSDSCAAVGKANGEGNDRPSEQPLATSPCQICAPRMAPAVRSPVRAAGLPPWQTDASYGMRRT